MHGFENTVVISENQSQTDVLFTNRDNRNGISNVSKNRTCSVGGRLERGVPNVTYRISGRSSRDLTQWQTGFYDVSDVVTWSHVIKLQEEEGVVSILPVLVAQSTVGVRTVFRLFFG